MGEKLIIPLHDELEFPGQNLPERVQNLERPLAPWFRLAMNQGLGKKSNIDYNAEHVGPQPAPVDILQIEGSDLDACQLQVTLGSPLAIPRKQSDLAGLNLQNQTGEFSASQIGLGDYPGTVLPIVWPPFIAIVEWGIGGARTRAYVDFVAGATINLTASFLRVTAAVAPDAIHVPGNTGLYTLSAFVGPGFPRPGSAQRTIYAGTLDVNDESSVLVVPPFAKRATVIGCDESTSPPQLTSASLQFWQSPNGTKNVGNYFATGNQPGSFNVPNAGNYFTVVGGVTGPTLYAVVFELSI